MAVDRMALKRALGGINRDVFVEDDHLVNHAQQDCTPIIDFNSRLRQHTQVGSAKMGAKLVARVPDIFYYVIWPEEFRKKYGMRKNESTEARKLYRDFYMAKLNEREFSAFRVDGGRL